VASDQLLMASGKQALERHHTVKPTIAAGPVLRPQTSIADVLRLDPLRHVAILAPSVHVRLIRPIPRLPVAPRRCVDIVGVGVVAVGIDAKKGAMEMFEALVALEPLVASVELMSPVEVAMLVSGQRG
jgi:hypothetical protein